MKENNKEKLGSCPNCGTINKEEDYRPSFRYATLIECPKCIGKIKPNNSVRISSVLSDV